MTPEFDPAQPPLIDEDRHPVFDSWEGVENVESLDCAEDEDDEPQRPINWNLLTSDEAETYERASARCWCTHRSQPRTPPRTCSRSPRPSTSAARRPPPGSTP